MRITLSFRGWILVGTITVILCSLVFLYVTLVGFIKSRLIEQTRTHILREAGLMQDVIADKWSPVGNQKVLDDLADEYGKMLSVRITLIDPSGAVLGDSETDYDALGSLSNQSMLMEVRQALAEGAGWRIEKEEASRPEILHAATVYGSTDAPKLIVRITAPLDQIDEALERLRMIFAWVAGIAVVLAVIAAYIIAHSIFEPVKDLTLSAWRITSGDFTTRLRRYPSHEMGELGRAFDRMADHLQKEIRAVTTARDQMEAVLTGMVEGVMLTDREGRVLIANRALRRLLHLEKDPEGRTPIEILRRFELQEMIQGVLKGQVYASSEINTLGVRPKILEVHVVGLTGDDSHSGAVAVFHDITARKHLEEVRRDFVANVSHELRTPLTAIRGAVETLLDGALSDPKYARHFGEVIKRHVDRLQSLLNDLLDLAKIESGEAEPRTGEISAAEFADSVLSAVSDLAESKGVELLRDLPKGPFSFKGDRRQLEQALVNLLDNAVKYTMPGGRVTLTIGNDGEDLCLGVTDTGIGIPEEHLPRIFERFYRVDKARSRDLGGTGLGLAIVKHITQAHGGRLRVESKPNKGSTFQILIPSKSNS